MVGGVCANTIFIQLIWGSIYHLIRHQNGWHCVWHSDKEWVCSTTPQSHPKLRHWSWTGSHQHSCISNSKGCRIANYLKILHGQTWYCLTMSDVSKQSIMLYWNTPSKIMRLCLCLTFITWTYLTYLSDNSVAQLNEGVGLAGGPSPLLSKFSRKVGNYQMKVANSHTYSKSDIFNRWVENFQWQSRKFVVALGEKSSYAIGTIRSTVIKLYNVDNNACFFTKL